MIAEWTHAINDRSIQQVLEVADPEGLWVRLWDILGNRLSKMQGLGPEDSQPEAAEGAMESKPAVTTTPATPVAPTAPVSTPPAVPTPPVVPTPTAKPEVEQVNSSTHRKEHARLTRKMQSLCESEFPHMHKLWAGNRQDSYVFEFLVSGKKAFCFHVKKKTFVFTYGLYNGFNVHPNEMAVPGKERIAEGLDYQR